MEEIIPGTTFHQKITAIPSPDTLQDGEILVETLYLSLDPGMRGWLKGMTHTLNHTSNSLSAHMKFYR